MKTHFLILLHDGDVVSEVDDEVNGSDDVANENDDGVSESDGENDE